MKRFLLWSGWLLLSLLPYRPLFAQSNGQLALVGNDTNLYLYDLATSALTPLTDDAQLGIREYRFPTWSTDGQLAYFASDSQAENPFRLGVYIRQPNSDTSVLAYQTLDEAYTYAHWAPADCPLGNCRDLALLYTDIPSSSLKMRLLRSRDQGATFDLIETESGTPFYWDWSSDGTQMFWARFNQTLQLYDVASASITQEWDESQGSQRSVDWSPVDNRLLTTLEHFGNASDLVILDGDERTYLARGIEGLMSYAWNATAEYVAFTDNDLGGLYVIDTASSEKATFVDERVLAFFWSPNGEHLAYVTFGVDDKDTNARKVSLQVAPVMTWHVYHVLEDRSESLANFLPSSDMMYLLPYFDQFAHSHSLWSADSRYLVYGETTPNGDTIVSLLDTQDAGRPPQKLLDGSFGVFSWD
ncbi:MAG: hypothetical protein ACOYLB_12715 [Phototrophicaceae bacterium]